MLLGGAVAGQGAIDIYLLIAIAWFAAWAGDTTSFFIGRRLGREFVLTPRAALRDRPRALRTGRGLLLPPRRQDDLHRPLHQPRPRLRPLHRRQLGHALPRLRPLQHPRHRALGQRPHPRSATSSRAASTPPPSTPAKAPSCSATLIVDRGRRGRRSSATSGSRRTGAPRCAGWRATRRPAGSSSLGRRFRPQLALPLGPGHARRHLRARVHLADGDPRRRPLRARRLHGDRRRRTRARPRAT